MAHISRLCALLTAAILLGTAFSPAPTQAQDAPFITIWDTENSGGTNDDQIKIPGTGTDYQIIWEEVGNTSNTDTLTATDEVTVTFPDPGIYRVKISGNFTRIHFGGKAGGDADKIIEISQWGDIEWSTMEEAFDRPGSGFNNGASNLDLSAKDTPDLSGVISMNRMFEGASSLTASASSVDQWDVSGVKDMSRMFHSTKFNQDIGSWDVSSVTNMGFMFRNADSFNRDIGSWNVSNVKDMEGMLAGNSFNQEVGSWDVSSVTNMESMFLNAKKFNQDISSWDVSNVTNMRGMFFGTNFNQDISSWDVSSVTNMILMFRFASEFNRDIGSWDVSNVTSMRGMFEGASSFNQDISSWDVSNVNIMARMFSEADKFDQNIGQWDVSNVTNMDEMFDGTALSTTNYDRILIEWSFQDLQEDFLSLGASGVEYCDSGPFRTHISEVFDWDINDSGRQFGCPELLASTQAQQISSDGTFDFGSAASLTFFGTIGNGRVTLAKYSDSPRSIESISEDIVSEYRLTILNGGITFFDSTRVSLPVSEYAGINQPEDVVVYKRPQPGNGPFEALTLTVDDNGTANRTSDDTLSIKIAEEFGELVLASDSRENPLGRDIPPIAPSNLSAQLKGRQVSLSWSVVTSEDLAGYRLYRSAGRSPDTSGAGLTEGLISETTFTDTTATENRTYRYGVTAVDTAGNESVLSAEASVFRYPSQIQAEISRSFGEAAGPGDYRLVALPGEGSRPIEDVISGEAGSEWQAYRDDGSQEDFFQKYDGSSDFAFKPGNGFWVTATSDLAFEDSVSTVPLEGDSAATIPLREGWNVISNPTGKAVQWTRVREANPGSLQPLFGFEGTFSRADSLKAATSGRAYYLFNGSADRTELRVPYPGSPPSSGGQTDSKAGSRPLATGAGQSEASRSKARLISLSASLAGAASAGAGGPTSTVRVGVRAEEATRSVVAPPSRFEAVSLRIEAGEVKAGEAKAGETKTGEAEAGEKNWQDGRSGLLMAQLREGDGGGETFRLRLKGQAGAPVQLEASGVGEAESAALIRPSVGKTYRLRDGKTVRIEGAERPVSLKLAVGTESYVEGKREEAMPEKVRLTSYPNPVRRQGTLEYTLPEAGEVTLKVYDVLGRRVATLAEGRKQAGRHEVSLRVGDLPSGAYFGRLEAGGETRTQKITVVR